MSESKNNRKYFRLAYPTVMRPSVRIEGRDYIVPEISEGGLRLRCQEPFEFRIGDEVTGELMFRDGDNISIAGVVFRRASKDFVIAPLKGLSFKKIVLEQRRILRQFPCVNMHSENEILAD